MIDENLKKEEGVGVDPHVKEPPERPKVWTQVELQAKPKEDTPPAYQEVPSVTVTSGDNQEETPRGNAGDTPGPNHQETSQGQCLIQKYKIAAQAAWKTWQESLGNNGDRDQLPNKPLLPDECEGRIKLSEQTTRKATLRNAYGVLFSRLIFTLVVMGFFQLAPPYFYVDNILIICLGVLLAASGVVMTVYLEMKTKPNSTPRVVISGVWAQFASIYMGFLTCADMFYIPDSLFYAVGVLAALSLVLMLYMCQSKVDFTIFRAILLCNAVIDICFAITYPLVYYDEQGMVFMTFGFMLFSIYLVYDMYSNLRGTERYSLLRQLASQWPQCSKTSTQNQEDGTATYPQQEESRGDIPVANNHGGYLQSNLQPQTGWKTYLGYIGDDLKGDKLPEKNMPLDEEKDEETLQSTRKAFVLRAYTFLIYYLLATKYVFGLFTFSLQNSMWFYRNFCFTCSFLQMFLILNVPTVVTIILYASYKTRDQSPKRWLFSLGLSSLVGNSYVIIIAAFLYMQEILFIAVFMAIFVSLSLMGYLSRTKSNFNILTASLICYAVIQTFVAILFWCWDWTLWAALIVLLFSLCLVFGTRGALQGTQRCNIITFFDNFYGTKPPSKEPEN